jgi:L-ascorbate metabolism protein UlaG (beta-lactamase superfamily)
MDITWHGQANFTVKGNAATVVVDPFEKDKIGLPKPKLAGDVVLVSHQHYDHNDTSSVGGEPHVVDLPGEYEYAGVMIQGLPSYHDSKEGAERGDNIIFSFTVDGVHCVHLGDLGHTLTDQDIDQIGDVDILFIPVGGEYTIDAKTAIDVIKKLQPRVTVPMHYDVPGLDLPKKLAGVEDFLKQAGGKVQRLEKTTWKVKSSDLPEDESIIAVFPNP